MAVNYSRAPIARYRSEAARSTVPKTKPRQRLKPTNAEQSSPEEKYHQPSGPASDSLKIPTAPSAEASISDGTAAAEASSEAVVKQEDTGTRRLVYDSDIEAESAYQRAMWEKIQQSQHEIQKMRTPVVNVVVPVDGFHEPNHWPNPGNGSNNVFHKSGMTASQSSLDASHHGVAAPPNYVDLNRRQVHHRSDGSSVGRRVALYPSKTYSEMFAMKKENEISYTNIGTKNVFGGISTFLPFGTGCRCEYDPRGCPCRFRQLRERRHLMSDGAVVDHGEGINAQPSDQIGMYHYPHYNSPGFAFYTHPRHDRLGTRSSQYAGGLGRDAAIPLPAIANERQVPLFEPAIDRFPHRMYSVGALGAGWPPSNYVGFADPMIGRNDRVQRHHDYRHEVDGVHAIGAPPGGNRWPLPPIVTDGEDAVRSHFYRLHDGRQQVNLQLDVNLVAEEDPVRPAMTHQQRYTDALTVIDDAHVDHRYRRADFDISRRHGNRDARLDAEADDMHSLAANNADLPSHWRTTAAAYS